MTCLLPTVIATPDSAATQTNGGVEITLTPEAFRCALGSQDTTVDATPTIGEMLRSIPTELPFSALNDHLLKNTYTHCFVETTATPLLRPRPKRLRFTVKIRNRLPETLRGADLVVSFVVGGQLQAAAEDSSAELADATIPPDGEQQLEIFGPPVATIPSGATIGVLLSAPPGTETRDFAWRFLLTTETRQESGTVKKSRGWSWCHRDA